MFGPIFWVQDSVKQRLFSIEWIHFWLHKSRRFFVAENYTSKLLKFVTFCVIWKQTGIERKRNKTEQSSYKKNTFRHPVPNGSVACWHMLSALFKQFSGDVCYKPLDRLLLVLETKFSGMKFIGRAKPDSPEHYSTTGHIVTGPCSLHPKRMESSFPFGQQCKHCVTTVS
jgi:hypothetical protein